MRRARDDRRLFRGSERSRLLTLCLMLAMLCVLIPTVRNRHEWFNFFVERPSGPPPAEGDKTTAGKTNEAGRAKTEVVKTDTAKTDTAKTDTAKTDTAKTDTAKTDTAKTDTAKTDTAKTEAAKTAAAKTEAAKTEPPKSLAETPVPAPLGDEELEEERLKELLSVVQDGGLKLNDREMPAYYHLLKKANGQKLEVLQAEARRDPRFNDFHQFASKHRGELVQIELNVRKIEHWTLPQENNIAGVKDVYELWGWTQQAKAWLYVGIVSELPEGLKVGEVEERVTLVGYFFKMQGYHAGDAKAGARPMVAPLIIGRIVWRPAAPPAQEPWWMWVALAAGTVVIVGFFAVRILSSLRRRPVGSKTATERPARLGDWLQSAPADEVKPAEPGDKPVQ
jgi:hypothetical protein